MTLLPRYGTGSLAEVGPALLGALGVAFEHSGGLSVPSARAACLLLIDGLGWELLRDHPRDAPTLTGLAAGTQPITAGFPATTATSVSSLGTARAPGEHGVVGYAFEAGPDGQLLNALTWCRQGGDREDLRDIVVPEQFQPGETVFERAVAGGVDTCVVAPPIHRGSGLSRAVLRGGRFRATHGLGDLADGIIDVLSRGRAFCYAYHGDLDLLGHVYGPGSRAWRWQLRVLDRLVSDLIDRMPAGSVLAIVADHGMVAVDDLVDVDDTPALLDGVRLVGGEVRARHVYVRPGALEDVVASWRGVLGGRAWVLPREEAVAAGWFGPVVDPRVAGRFGDLVVALRGTAGVVRRTAEPLESSLEGQHGSLTAAEQLIPFLLAGSV